MTFKERMGRVGLIAGLAIAIGACAEIGPGERGIFVNQGEATSSVGPGWHSYFPITTDLVSMNVRQQKWDGETVAYTEDVQQAGVQFTLTYSLSPDMALETYRDVGEDWFTTLVPQVVYQSIKDEFGQSEAVADAINKRGELQGNIRENLTETLAARGVVVHGFELTNIDFSAEFDAANEDKQIAVERATTAQNNTVRIEEEARQQIITAEAEAESMRIRSAALASNPALTDYEAVQRWDGKLCPASSTCIYGEGAMPFVNAGGN